MFSFNQKTYLLLTIMILSIIFFICGILHILIKFLLKPIINSESEETSSATAFQGQLQQLFHLHDKGVDQSFIDSLPLFFYKSIIGLKDPSDCVVCLCEFELDDKLRLLPNCSHAFHIECIDTWLLSHSTCPLCRQSLFHEHLSEGSRVSSSNFDDDFVISRREVGVKEELNLKKEFSRCMELPLMAEQKQEFEKKMEDELNLQYVKLGKFRNVENGEEGTSRGNGDLKERCFSMGAIEYVMNERTVLQVAIKTLKKQPTRIHESFSVSKISTGSRREKGADDDCSRRAFSLRWPKHIGDLGLDLEAGRRRQKIKVVNHG